MARTTEDIVRMQIGSLFIQIATLTADNESLKERLAEAVRETSERPE